MHTTGEWVQRVGSQTPLWSFGLWDSNKEKREAGGNDSRKQIRRKKIQEKKNIIK